MDTLPLLSPSHVELPALQPEASSVDAWDIVTEVAQTVKYNISPLARHVCVSCATRAVESGSGRLGLELWMTEGAKND